MKKIIALACAVVLTAGMSLTAVAAPSVNGGIVTGVAGAKDDKGNSVEIVVAEIPEEDKTVAEEIQKPENVKNVIGSSYTEDMEVVSVIDAKVEGDPNAISWPVTITFNVKGVTASSKVVLLHYNKTNFAWEVIESTVGEGTVTGKFYSLSPVAIVVEKASSGTPSSPKTGDTTVYAWMTAILAAAAAGVVVTAKKKRA